MLEQIPSVLGGSATVKYRISEKRRSRDIVISMETSHVVNSQIIGDSAPQFQVRSASYTLGYLEFHVECLVAITGSSIDNGSCAGDSLKTLNIALDTFPSTTVDISYFEALFGSSKASSLLSSGGKFIAPGEFGLNNGGFAVAIDTSTIGSSSTTYLFAMNYAGSKSFAYSKISLTDAPAPDTEPDPTPDPEPDPPTPDPEPDPPTPDPEPPPSSGNGLWISPSHLASLPMSGSAWNALKSQADKSAGTPNLCSQTQDNNVNVMAKALVYARTGQNSYRAEVRSQLGQAIDTEKGSDCRTLALGRELAAYVIAADLIDLPNYDSSFDTNQFRPWLRETLTEELSGKTLVSTHEGRPNNWGTHAGSSRAAVAVYLGDMKELARTAQVFKGWVGDRASYANFKYGDLSWQCDPNKPVGINPQGCTRDGHSIDGVIPDDQRRNGGFTWPPPKANYVWGSLQGAVSQAQILYQAGYDVFNWENKALYRSLRWLHNEANFAASGDDEWIPHVINFHYKTNFPAQVPTPPGKNVGWTDWTHQ